MQSSLSDGNIIYEWQTRRCVYVDLFIYASILAPTKVPVATGIETLSSAPVVYRDAVLLMGQYGKPTDTTLIYLKLGFFQCPCQPQG